jgi:hypothetical protein
MACTFLKLDLQSRNFRLISLYTSPILPQEVDEDSAELSISGGATSGLPAVQIVGGGSDDHGLSQQCNQVVLKIQMPSH